MYKKEVIITKIICVIIALQQIILFQLTFSKLTPGPYSNLPRLVFLIVTLLYVLFGIGLLALIDWVRNAFIAYQILAVAGKIVYAIFTLGALAGDRMPSSFNFIHFSQGLSFPLGGVFHILRSNPTFSLLPFLVNLFYIYYFIRPRTQVQFKQP